MPPRTLGMCLASTYVLCPGRDTRRRPEMTDVRSSVYLRWICSLSPAEPGAAPTWSKPAMYPCSCRIRAISRFRPLEGITTVSWDVMIPLRIRVRKAAMGSVIDMALPARLRHARDVAVVGEPAQAHAAQANLAVHGGGPAAAAAARVGARLVLRRARHTGDL